MTTIVAKNGWIASDSRYVLDVTPTRSITYNAQQKFFILPSNQAVVAFSGSISDELVFDKILTEVQAVIARYIANEPLNDKQSDGMFPISVGHIGVVIVATKEFTLLGDIADNTTWTYYPKDKPVMCGSGTTFISTKSILSKTTTATDLVREAMLVDEMTGGKIFCFNLDNLDPVSVRKETSC